MNNMVKELDFKFKKIKKDGWILGDKNNAGSAGILFERLIDKTNNNFELPDFNNIEIKTKIKGREQYITLFVATPDSYLFEIKRILDRYGYKRDDNNINKIFNTSLYSNYTTKIINKYFKIFVDYKDKNVVMKVYDNNYCLIDSDSKWSFDMLEEKLLRKLSYLAIIDVEKMYKGGKRYFRYTDISFYKLRDFKNFLLLVRSGKIRITFRIGFYKDGIRCGKIYDHGTSFSIRKDNIELLFTKFE